MTEEEKIYKYLQKVRVDKLPLENEIFAIRDSRKKTNDYTIYVDGYISLDAINKNIDKLNLIQKLQEEKENYKRMLAEIHAQSLNNSITEKEKHEEQLEVLNEGWKIELEKKDKIIDFMAEFIDNNLKDCLLNIIQENGYCEDTDRFKKCKDCIIQYFENKAEQSSGISTIKEEK